MKFMNIRRTLLTAATVLCAIASALASTIAMAQAEPADAFVRRTSNDLLESIKADKSMQSGDVQRLAALVDAKVMPSLDFERMTASAVGKYWRQATPPQRDSLQSEFKTLLVRTYAGALAQVRDQRIEVKPMRGNFGGKELVVRTEVRGAGDPVQLDYRLEQTNSGWKIYDVNIMGVWLVENYRGSFSQEISNIGVDGLIAKLSQKNKARN
jgi:phospholipid transport system substrate-binding protein